MPKYTLGTEVSIASMLLPIGAKGQDEKTVSLISEKSRTRPPAGFPVGLVATMERSVLAKMVKSVLKE